MTRDTVAGPAGLLAGKRVAFLGRLGGLTHREALNLVREQGGAPVERVARGANLVVVGADSLPLDDDLEGALDPAARQQAAEGKLEIISETEFWQRLGLVEREQQVRRLYTPAMLARLLGVPLAVVRRWRRRGLIVPAREVHRLPYYDFREVAAARRLAELLVGGASPSSIEKKLAELSRFVPDIERPLAQLGVIVDGRQLLLRQGEGLIEPSGQLRFDFESSGDPSDRPEKEPVPATLSLTDHLAARPAPAPPATAELLRQAGELEDEDRLEEAAELYRAVLSAEGARADVCFLLAEVLYQLGEIVAARERYYMAIELDPEFVEARANLGCVLAELGQRELAAAALEGALAYHPDFPDAHYHLAVTLEELDRGDRAQEHWRAFLELAPESPWAEEARARLVDTLPSTREE